jgi:hypothetical protein
MGLTYVGAGAFNLVRADAYRDCGGHRTLRLEVIDDMRLAGELRARGWRSRVFLGGGDCVVDWVAGLRSFFAALEKNLFAAVDFSRARAALAVSGTLALWTVAVTGPFTGHPAGFAAAAALASSWLPMAALAARQGWPRAAALPGPLLVPLVSLALANSAACAIARGGVLWRGTLMPLRELRAAARLRNR